MKIRNRIVYVFDNAGTTYDRFTIIIHASGEILGASSDPFHPLGVGQHCGEIKGLLPSHQSFYPDHKLLIRNHNNKKIAEYIQPAREDAAWLGHEVTDPVKLPEDVLQFITQNL